MSFSSLSLLISAFRLSYSLASTLASELTHNHTSAVDDISYAIEDAIVSSMHPHPSDSTSAIIHSLLINNSLPIDDAARHVLALLSP